MERPVIYDYSDYRVFMKDYIEYLRSKELYSVRSFAKKIGVGSSSFMKMVMDSKRNLSLETAEKVAEGFGLYKAEARYFCLLCQFNQAKKLSEQTRIYDEIRDFPRAEISRGESLHQYEFYSRWYTIAVYESLGTNWSPLSLKSLSSKLKLREYQVEQSLDILLDLDLIEKKRQQWRKKESLLRTPHETKSLLVRQFHKTMTDKALEAIDSLSPEERELNGVTIKLSQKKYELAVDRIRKFRSELNKLLASSDEALSDDDRIYHLNLQLFPLSTGRK